MKAGKIIALCLCFLFAGRVFAQKPNSADSVPLIVADSLKAVYIYADTGKALNRVDAQGRKYGLWEKRYPNGKLRYRGHFKEGNPNGVFKYYWDNDSIQNIAVYSHNGKVAYSKEFYENGGIFSTGKYVNQKRDSIWLFYDSSWKLYKKEQYSKGKKEGKSITFYENGGVLESKTFHGDVENGPWQQYFENGHPKLEATYVNGKLEGALKTYDQSNPDRPMVKGNYIHDLKNGPWIFYNRVDDRWDTIVYKNDKAVNQAKYGLSREKLDSLKIKYKDVQYNLDHPDMENPDYKKNDPRDGGGE